MRKIHMNNSLMQITNKRKDQIQTLSFYVKRLKFIKIKNKLKVVGKNIGFKVP